MKVPVMILNSMFLLLFVSVIIGEWGSAPAVVAGLAIVNLLVNAVFIQIKTRNDFGQESAGS